MPRFPRLKRASIALGVYEPARWLHRHFLDRETLLEIEAEKAFFRGLIGPEACLCFDCGANIGEKSEILLLCGYEVVAFEPQAECAREVRARCARFKSSIRVRQTAIGAAIGEHVLHVSLHGNMSSLSDTWNSEGDVKGRVTVPVTTIDAAIAEFGPPRYVKIDVEGWELEVLKGLSRPVPFLSIEYHLSEGGADAALACLERLAGFGEIKLNVTANESRRFRFPEWIGLEEFRGQFPAEFAGQDEWYYGDIFVKTEC